MIHHSDLFDVLPTLPEASFDACVTDPPYGLGFMGKEWDTFKPGAPRKQAYALVKGEPIVSDNPNLHGRRHSPAISESQIAYDRSLRGQRAFQAWSERWAREVFRVLKPGAHLLVCGAPRSSHRMVCGIEDAGFEIRDSICWLFGQGFPKSLNLGDGWGTALKPGHEPIALARKPVAGGVRANHEQLGVGGLNIDACRLPVADDAYARNASGDRGHDDNRTRRSEFAMTAGSASEIGRWPANVALDEAAAGMLDAQSGELVSGANPTRRASDKFRDVYSGFQGQAECTPSRGLDIGGASRFFYVAKPSRDERDTGIYDLEPRARDESRKDGNPGGDNPRNRGLQRRANFHPTVKPIELMRWLVRLVTPIGGTVLDPFMGSGTTGMACALEARAFIGIEREAEYVAIAERRIGACLPLFSDSLLR